MNHRHIWPSETVDKGLLEKMLREESIPEAVGLHETCYNAQSIRTGKKECGV
jgi:hypothetical protein